MEPSKSVSSSETETMDLVPSEADSDVSHDEIIHGLMKFPANQMCINCNSEGPQYVCTSFWTFVCKTCSEIHRRLGHQVKSVSAKFTSQEVDALQGQGNEHAWKVFFKDWGSQRLPESSLPDGSNVARLRDFIKHCYVDRRYTGEEVYMECVENRESDYIPLNDHIPLIPLMTKKIQESRRKAKAEKEEKMRKDKDKAKAYDEEGDESKKRKIEEMAIGLREKLGNALIIREELAHDKEKGESKKKDQAKAKAHDEEGDESKKRKIEEVATGLREIPENMSIIKDLPAFSLPPNEFVMKLRELIRLTVGVSQTSKPLTPIIACTSSRPLKPYPWKDQTIEQLASKGLETVSGEVRCLGCQNISGASLDWRDAWVKSASFMLANFITFGKDTYLSWTPPSDDFHIRCGACTGMKMVPHIDPTVEINWLFVFLTNTVSNVVSAPILEKYIRSRGILLSGIPSKKELVWFLHLYMLRLLDPGVWAGFSSFAKTPRDDERSSK